MPSVLEETNAKIAAIQNPKTDLGEIRRKLRGGTTPESSLASIQETLKAVQAIPEGEPPTTEEPEERGVFERALRAAGASVTGGVAGLANISRLTDPIIFGALRKFGGKRLADSFEALQGRGIGPDVGAELGELSDKLSEANKFQDSITGLAKKGQYAKAGEALAFGVIETLPQVGLIASMGPFALPILGLTTAGRKIAAIEDNPNMSEQQKVVNALITGTAEGLLEAVTLGWLAPIIKVGGRPAAKTAIGTALRRIVPEVAKKLKKTTDKIPRIVKRLEGVPIEALQEGTTQVVENLTDIATNNRDVNGNLPGMWDNVPDASLLGGSVGFLISGADIALRPDIQPREEPKRQRGLRPSRPPEAPIVRVEPSEITDFSNLELVENTEKPSRQAVADALGVERSALEELGLGTLQERRDAVRTVKELAETIVPAEVPGEVEAGPEVKLEEQELVEKPKKAAPPPLEEQILVEKPKKPKPVPVAPETAPEAPKPALESPEQVSDADLIAQEAALEPAPVPKIPTLSAKAEVLQSPVTPPRSAVGEHSAPPSQPPPTPLTLKKHPDAKRVTDAPAVMKTLEGAARAFGTRVPIRVGRFKEKAAGIFKVIPEVIRLRTALDISTAAHEIGHAIHATVHGSLASEGSYKGPQPTQAMKNELITIGKELYNDKQPAGGFQREGYAEWMKFFITNPSQAKKQAPKFHKWFTGTFLKAYPKGAQSLAKAQEQWEIWDKLGSVLRASQSIVDTGSLMAKAKKNGIALKEAFGIQQQVEGGDPIRILQNEIFRRIEEKRDITDRPFDLFKAFRGVGGQRVETMVLDTMIDLSGQAVEGVGPLKDVINRIGTGKKTLKQFSVYLWARRARAMLRDPKGPRNPGMTIEDADQIIEELETEDFKKAAEDVYKWQDAVLEYAAQASPTFAKIVEQIHERDPGDYIPLQRVFEDLDSIWASRPKGKLSSGQLLSGRLLGSGRRIRNPFSSMINNANDMVRAAHQQMVIDLIFEAAKIPGLGFLVEKVTADSAGIEFKTNVQDAMKKLNAVLTPKGVDVDLTVPSTLDMDIDVLAQSITFFLPSPSIKAGKDPIVPRWNPETQTMEFFQLNSKLFNSLDSIETLPVYHSFWSIFIMDWIIGKSKRAFVTGTTGVNASFGLLKNTARDAVSFYLQTRSAAAGTRLFYHYLQSMSMAALEVSTFGKVTSEPAKMYNRLGIGISQSLGVDMAKSRQLEGRLVNGKIIRTLTPSNWVRNFRDLIQFPEKGPRMTEMLEMLNMMGWKPGERMTLEQSLEALLAAKEVTTDFSAAGQFGRTMNQIVPFWNAAIQGPRAGVRAAKRDPAKFFRRGLALTAFSLSRWWKYKDEEWWTQMSNRERFLYEWFELVIHGKEVLMRIPRAFEIGATFQSLPVMLADAAYRQNPIGMKEWWDVFLQTSLPFGLPPLIQETKDQLQNMDSFWETPIVSRGLIGKEPKEQFNEYTTRMSIWIADKFSTEAFPLSPQRIDHAIPGLFGGVTRDIVEVIPGLGRREQVKDTELADIPVLGALFRRGGRLGTHPRVIGEFYEVLEKAHRRQASTLNPETSEERQRRLKLEDYAMAFGLAFDVRSKTKDLKTREEITHLVTLMGQNVLTGKRIPAKTLPDKIWAKQLRLLTNVKHITKQMGESKDRFAERKKEASLQQKRALEILRTLDFTIPDALAVWKRDNTVDGKAPKIFGPRKKDGSRNRTAYGQRILEISQILSKQGVQP